MKDDHHIAGKNLNKKRGRNEFEAYQVEQAYPYGQWRDHNTKADHAYTFGGGIGGVDYQGDRPQKIKVTRSELTSAAKSKLDFYNILTKEGQYYLPPLSECPMLFIRDIAMGKKKVGSGCSFQTLMHLAIAVQELLDHDD